MSKMRNIILIINILNFYVYQFIAIHKKVFPTYPIEITSEKIVGLLFTILCFIIFIFIDKLYPLRVEYIFIFIIPTPVRDKKSSKKVGNLANILYLYR